MKYMLKNKKTGDFAKLNFTVINDGDLLVGIDCVGDIYYIADNRTDAMKVLTVSNEYNSSVNSPCWDYKLFGDDYTVVSIDIIEQDIYNDIEDKFIYLPSIIDYNKCQNCFMINIPENVIDKIEIDHTLTNNIELPDKISYEYQGYIISYTEQKFNELNGQLVMLDEHNINYVHAVLNNSRAKELKLINSYEENCTVLIVSKIV